MSPAETAIAQAIHDADEEALDALADRIASRLDADRLAPLIRELVLRAVNQLWSITHRDVEIEMRKIAREALEDIIRELRPKEKPTDGTCKESRHQ